MPTKKEILTTNRNLGGPILPPMVRVLLQTDETSLPTVPDMLQTDKSIPPTLPDLLEVNG